MFVCLFVFSGDFIDHYSLMEIREYADVITNKATFQLALTQFKAVVRCMFDENGQSELKYETEIILKLTVVSCLK